MNFSYKWTIFWNSVLGSDAGPVSVRHAIATGFGRTMLIAFGGLLIGLIIGTLIAIIKLVPSENKVLGAVRKIANLYVNFFRGTPIVVQLLLGFFVLPVLFKFTIDGLPCAVLVFGLNSGAYVSEIMRSGILSVDYGQTEAGRAIGLNYRTTMTKIVIPQAVKNIIPTLGNELIALVKDTSVVSFIAVADLCTAFRNIGGNNYEYAMPYLMMALIYIVVVLILTYLIKLVERWMRRSDKR